jgi:hypothetical protein
MGQQICRSAKKNRSSNKTKIHRRRPPGNWISGGFFLYSISSLLKHPETPETAETLETEREAIDVNPHLLLSEK